MSDIERNKSRKWRTKASWAVITPSDDNGCTVGTGDGEAGFIYKQDFLEIGIRMGWLDADGKVLP